ncbi:MAG: enoyl-CoA hydratase/isomerase family protein, partial [Burkholderiales bacterium]|nr:enoyl-CoA hydratase/isomerase family protein [Burkholderiales bacterium]
MNNPVKSTLDDGILTIEIDHPPVNALALPVRAGLLAAMEAARTDARVQAVILQTAGRTFVAGGDIGEFAEPKMIDPHNNHVFAAMEALDKPIVAALHGSVLGGGLELAMAAHYRVALPGTRLGLPEVKLGIVPGAGGTQRLPRLVGVETALEMMTSGRAVDAGQALTMGLLDELESAPLRDAALALARKAIEAQRAGQPLPIASRRAIDNDAAQGDRLEAWRRRLPA